MTFGVDAKPNCDVAIESGLKVMLNLFESRVDVNYAFIVSSFVYLLYCIFLVFMFEF